MLKQLEMELQRDDRSSEEILRDFFKIKNPNIRNRQLLEGILSNLGFEKRNDRWEYVPTIPRDEFVVIDVETTGLSFKNGARIIEIGLVEIKRDKITRYFSTLINPGKKIPIKITSITGITTEMVLDKPPFEAVAPLILDFIGHRYLVAHNFSFDFSFLSGEFERLNIKLPRRGICTLQLARRFLNLRRNDLDSLARHFNLRFEKGRHRALGDAYVTAQAFISLKREILGNNNEDIIEFYNECCGIQKNS